MPPLPTSWRCWAPQLGVYAGRKGGSVVVPCCGYAATNENLQHMTSCFFINECGQQSLGPARALELLRPPTDSFLWQASPSGRPYASIIRQTGVLHEPCGVTFSSCPQGVARAYRHLHQLEEVNGSPPVRIWCIDSWSTFSRKLMRQSTKQAGNKQTGQLNNVTRGCDSTSSLAKSPKTGTTLKSPFASTLHWARNHWFNKPLGGFD